MALYDYKCPVHGIMEVSHRISAPPLTGCPKDDCNESVERLIGTTSFTLQGGGWYKDGYASTKR
jgi:putative FmdB family regulatory protein